MNLLGLLVVVVALCGVLPGATLTVTNLGDSGVGTLRQAILDHNSAGGTNTIDFAVSGTVTLASILPTIADGDLTINGNGSSISGDSSGAISDVYPGAGIASVTLNGLTISEGFGLTGCAVRALADTGSVNLTLSRVYYLG